ncbi:unnamed protein product [Peniophora sp. CBMAI 1063]|nr:unnamed protein product [Peniophora sp. CBMAI 1063]
MLNYRSAFSSPSPNNTPSLEPSPKESLESLVKHGENDTGDNSFGFPLERMVPLERIRRHQSSSSESPDDSDEQEEDRLPWPLSMPSSSSLVSQRANFEKVVDEYMEHHASSAPYNMIFVENLLDEPYSPSSSMLIMHAPSDSIELHLLQTLDRDPLRDDPWNPAPRILHHTTRGTITVVCFERLFEYDQPPMVTVANVVDFVRQALEGLTFLHENRIAHRAYGDAGAVMVDIGMSDPNKFDRATLPVQYYRVDFSHAEQLKPDASLHCAALIQDVRDCGRMFTALVDEVPPIGRKLQTLINAMDSGEYGADDARKLFEALCRTIDHTTYETPLSTLLAAPGP